MGYKLGTKFYSNTMREIIRIDISPSFYLVKINFNRLRVKSPRKLDSNNQLISLIITNLTNQNDLISKIESKFKVSIGWLIASRNLN